MGHRRNLVVSLLVSMAAHGVILLVVITLFLASAYRLAPAFRRGVTSVSIEFIEPAAPEPVPAVPIEPAPPRPVVAPSEPVIPVVPPPPPPEKSRNAAAEPVASAPAVITPPTEAPALRDGGDEVAQEPDPDPDLAPLVTDPAVERSPVKAEHGSVRKETQREAGGPNLIASSNLQPPYPFLARLRGEEGTVVLKAVINDRGDVVEAGVVTSSGHSALDNSALKAVKHAHFSTRNGEPIRGGDVTLPINFKLVQ